MTHGLQRFRGPNVSPEQFEDQVHHGSLNAWVETDDWLREHFGAQSISSEGQEGRFCIVLEDSHPAFDPGELISGYGGDRFRDHLAAIEDSQQLVDKQPMSVDGRGCCWPGTEQFATGHRGAFVVMTGAGNCYISTRAQQCCDHLFCPSQGALTGGAWNPSRHLELQRKEGGRLHSGGQHGARCPQYPHCVEVQADCILIPQDRNRGHVRDTRLELTGIDDFPHPFVRPWVFHTTKLCVEGAEQGQCLVPGLQCLEVG
ncbi:hypothetical protein D3C81_1104220 [compost metagenome]